MLPIDEALQRIRDTWPANADHLKDLEERLKGAAHPIPLLPFVGAGLSMPMGFPGWGRFLSDLAGECGKTAEVTALMVVGAYEEAAELIEQSLSPTIFNKRVAHAFGKRKSDECELKGAVLALPELASGAVVTTNFDRLLERVFTEANGPFEHVAWGAQVDAIKAAVAANKPFLLKIHGDAEERTNRVLTKREYDKHYASTGDPEGLRAQVGRVFQGRTVLFVGCSLDKDRTMDALFDILQTVAGHEHYAILAKPADEARFFAKQQYLGEHGILPIWYPDGRHELVEPLLRWIASLHPAPGRGPELVLESPATRRLAVRSELDLLIPYQRITEFVGREAEFASLREWAFAGDVSVSVRVVTGGGGSGKTRMAIELVETALKDDWEAGFLTAGEMERFSGLQNLSTWRRRKPVLAVIDYAATAGERLKQWLEQLAKDGGREDAKLRLLLLEREASINEGWLSSAMTRGHAASGVRELFDLPGGEPMRLPLVTQATDRRAVLAAALRRGAAFRGVPVPHMPLDATFEQQLAEAKWGDPLTLMMAGLTALNTGLVAAMAFGRLDLAMRLAERELWRAEKFAPAGMALLMRHGVAYVTVCGGLSRAELREAAKAESEALGFDGWGVFEGRLWEAMGGGQAVQPDVVGEALLLRVWGGGEVAVGRAAVIRAARLAGRARGAQVAAAVIRTTQDFCVGATPREEALDWLDGLIEEGSRDFGWLVLIEDALPHQTLALRERAVAVDSRMADLLRGSTGTDADSPSELARVLSNLGNRLSELGRREEALAAAEEAVRIRRELAAQRPDAFLPDVAMSLNNVGIRLSKLGRREEALAAAEEAVEIYRGLAAQRPDAFLPYLGSSLNNVGTMLSELGRREEALAAAEEAVEIDRGLAAQRPDASLPYLAMSLNNLGTMLSELGRRKEALAAAEEAVRIRRGLAAQRPDAFIPDLAMSLGAKGAILDANGERSQARDCFREGIVCLKSLFLRLPVAHRRLMLGLVGGYVRACQAAGSEPDGALLYDLLEPLGFGSGEPSE